MQGDVLSLFESRLFAYAWFDEHIAPGSGAFIGA
jgi:hypothetical protein